MIKEKITKTYYNWTLQDGVDTYGSKRFLCVNSRGNIVICWGGINIDFFLSTYKKTDNLFRFGMAKRVVTSEFESRADAKNLKKILNTFS